MIRFSLKLRGLCFLLRIRNGLIKGVPVSLFILTPLFQSDVLLAQVIRGPILYTKTLPEPVVGNYESLHSVVVMSAIGENITLQNEHFFGPKKRKLPIEDWQIDELVVRAIKSYLGSRFDYLDIPYDRGAIAAVPNGRLDFSTRQLKTVLQKLPNSGANAYIVVRPDEEFSNFEGGLMLDRANVGNPPAVLWANYEIDIIDARSLEIVGRAVSRIQMREGTNPDFANFIADKSLELEDSLNPDNEQIASLQSLSRRLVRYSILETLRALKVDAALPSVGARAIMPLDASDAPFQQVKTVAIASAIGELFELKRESLVGYDTGSIAISDWNIDEEIERDVRAALGKRFLVRDVPFDRKQLAKSRLLDDAHRFAPSFLGLDRSTDIDAYLVVVELPVQLEDYIRSSEGAGIGLGLWMPNAGLHSDLKSGVYAGYGFALVNAQTLRVMAVRRATVGPRYPRALPYAYVDKSLWPEKMPVLSADQVHKIQETLTPLLNDSVQETLLQMGLTDMRIADDLPTTNAAAAP